MRFCAIISGRFYRFNNFNYWCFVGWNEIKTLVLLLVNGAPLPSQPKPIKSTIRLKQKTSIMKAFHSHQLVAFGCLVSAIVLGALLDTRARESMYLQKRAPMCT
jgi:hypothetical protein